MPNFESPFLKALSARGFIHQCTDDAGLDALLKQQTPVPAYIGFDCTAPSLHVGSLLQIMALRWLQKNGHKPIVLMGGGTTKVGDPSGKDESRKLLDDAGIQKNMDGIKTVFSKFIEFENSFDAKSNKAFMVNNADWLDGLKYIKFLRDYGRHFSVNRMMSMDSVKLRLEREQHLSFLEFNYMILQAYDFVELNKKYQCRLQIGGSDQWANIINGLDLWVCHTHDRMTSKKKRDLEIDTSAQEISGENHKILVGYIKDVVAPHINNNHLFGLTTPLITTSSGSKMGKTSAGAVWLNADMTSPYDYWQFWRNTEDGDVGRFLSFFTELSDAEITALKALQGADINKAKIVLANEATKLAHGEAAAKAAEETARKTFEQGGVGGELPVFEVPSSKLKEGVELFALLFDAKLATSKGEARKQVQQGAAYINGEQIKDEKYKVTLADVKGEGIKLSKGKKNHVLVKAV
jgi:tyrosyl-tRNA synthetase